MKVVKLTDVQLQQAREFVDIGVRAQCVVVAAAALGLMAAFQSAEDEPAPVAENIEDAPP